MARSVVLLGAVLLNRLLLPTIIIVVLLIILHVVPAMLDMSIFYQSDTLNHPGHGFLY